MYVPFLYAKMILTFYETSSFKRWREHQKTAATLLKNMGCAYHFDCVGYGKASVDYLKITQSLKS